MYFLVVVNLDNQTHSSLLWQEHVYSSILSIDYSSSHMVCSNVIREEKKEKSHDWDEQEKLHSDQKDNIILYNWLSWVIFFIWIYVSISYHMSMYKMIICIQSLVATLWSLYYWRFWDPMRNALTWQFFSRELGYTPCDLCWFARILMYPIVFLISYDILTKKYTAYPYIIILSGLGVVLESYQYRYQMTASSADILSSWCWWLASCAAIDVIYMGFITIPFMCLVAFIVIFISSIAWYRKHIRG